MLWVFITVTSAFMVLNCSLHFNRLMTKPSKWHVRPAKTQISLDICSDFAVRLKKAWVLSYPLSAQLRLIRLGAAQANLSLRWAHIILLVLSWGGSFQHCTLKLSLHSHAEETAYDLWYLSSHDLWFLPNHCPELHVRIAIHFMKCIMISGICQKQHQTQKHIRIALQAWNNVTKKVVAIFAVERLHL